MRVARGLTAAAGMAALAAAATGLGAVADHEGALERVDRGPFALTLSGFAHDRTSTAPVQVQATVDGVVRATVTADQPRPSGTADGFTAQIPAPGQPASVCAVTVPPPGLTGLVLGCRQPPFPVALTVVGPGGAPAPGGLVARVAWVAPSGSIAKELEEDPLEVGGFTYSGRPLPRGARWAIAVRAQGSGGFIFRSGPLTGLPRTEPLATVLTLAVRVVRPTTPVSFGLSAPDGAPQLVRQAFDAIPGLRISGVTLTGDAAGREVVTARGTLRVGIVRVGFTYRIALRLRPSTQPGKPAELVYADPEGTPALLGPGLGRFAERLRRAAQAGVQNALNTAITRVAGIDAARLVPGFSANRVSVSAIQVTGTGNVVVAYGAGSVTGDTRPVAAP